MAGSSTALPSENQRRGATTLPGPVGYRALREADEYLPAGVRREIPRADRTVRIAFRVPERGVHLVG